jgi:hypothetical protein
MQQRVVQRLMLVLLVVFVLYGNTSFVRGQAPLTRSALNIPEFVITAIEGSDAWGPADSAAQIGYWVLDSLYTHRYLYDSSDVDLGLNCANSAINDYPAQTAPDSIVTKGKYNLPYVMTGSNRLGWVQANSTILRFECERHPTRANTLEYPGFQAAPGHAYTGMNAYDAGGTMPPWLKTSADKADTASNVVQLEVGRDDPAIFCDSLYSATFAFTGGPFRAADLMNQHGDENSKWLLRFRVRVDGTITDSTTPLFIVRVEQDSALTDSTRSPHSVRLLDTVRTDSRFVHSPSSYDTISIPMYRLISVDSTWFQLSWPGNLSMTMDYMEVLTAKLDTTNDFHRGIYGYFVSDSTIDVDGYGPPDSPYDANEWIASDSYQGLTENGDARLIALVDTFINRYRGHINLVQFGEEPPIGNYPLLKRFTKLLRDRSNDSIETIDIVHDSIDQNLHDSFNLWNNGFYGLGIHSEVTDYLEGCRFGWYDTSKYADPKFFMTEPYVWGYEVPLPRRNFTAAWPTDSLKTYNWQLHYATINIGSHSAPELDATYGLYSPDNYITSAQHGLLFYINSARWAKRVCLRNDADSLHQRFFVALETGCSPNRLNQDTIKQILVYGIGLRAPTAPEIKVTGHLAVSCGATGLMLYAPRNGMPDPKGSTRITGGNGGIMSWDGKHNTNFEADTLLKDTGGYYVDSIWVGWKENYDSVKALIPILKTYGDTLLHSAFVADIRANENYSSLNLPFGYRSIKTLNDLYEIDSFSTSDTTNRTLVHVSVWVDTAKGQQDTLLYITNLRTDDSYVWNATETDSIPGTMDRRVIQLKLKRPHRIADILDTNGSLDPGRVWTPYVGSASSDSLVVYLNAGDGILVRLMDTIPSQPQQAMAAPKIDYPKNNQSNHFYDHGRIVFDQPVPGVRNKSIGAGKDWSIPSTWKTYKVGIPNNDTVRMWQDSTLYQTPTVDRTQNWRNQNWTATSSGVSSIGFNFKTLLGPTSSTTPRPVNLSLDSVTHPVTIVTDLEARGNIGEVKLYDPFFVDSATLRNFNTTSDTLQLNSPWLPGYGTLYGGDKQHYGGVFLHQNDQPLRSSVIPMYGLSAYATLRKGTLYPSDSTPNVGDYAFVEWYKTDSVSANDPEDWRLLLVPPGSISLQPTMPVVFRTDSATYTARYKKHMTTNGIGSGYWEDGFQWNNQRKMFYLYTDSAHHQWYQMVYTSQGRVFTAFGWRDTLTNALTFLPEHCVSDWRDTTGLYVAMMLHHLAADRSPYCVYQADGTIIEAQRIDATEHYYQRALPLDSTDHPLAISTPVISGTDLHYHGLAATGLDVMAWASHDGIHVMAANLLPFPTPNASLDTFTYHPPLWAIGDSTDTSACFPTIWVDSAWSYDSTGAATVHFWLAWQARLDTTHTHIYVIQLQAMYATDSTRPFITTVPGELPLPLPISKTINRFAVSGMHPCISGCRIKSDTTVVRLSYEVGENTTPAIQGISVLKWRTGAGWTSDFVFATDDPSDDSYIRPSLECSRYHGDTLTSVPHDNYYTLAHVASALGVRHWAYDKNTTRVSGTIVYGGTDYPQLSVVPTSHDSLIRELSITLSDSAITASNVGWLFKVGGNDTIWEYRDITEARDTSGEVQMQNGIGEIAVDDGSTVRSVDLALRDDGLKVDSNHSAAYFMSSECFTLPASGAVSYFEWVGANNDSLFKLRVDSVRYALDFYDTTGAFVQRLDSLLVKDSTGAGTTRTALLSNSSARRGYVSFHRISQNLQTANALWQDIITLGKFSSAGSEKRGIAPTASNAISLTAAPNPLKNQTTLSFTIPEAGAVTVDILDIMGRNVANLANERQFHAGTHSLIWNNGSLESGVYLMVLHYGNSVKTLRLAVLK